VSGNPTSVGTFLAQISVRDGQTPTAQQTMDFTFSISLPQH
jgi:hypothetical protein